MVDKSIIGEERELKNSIARLVSILHRHSQIYINYALKEFGITSAEYSFLLHLYRKDGLTQEELSSYLCIDKPLPPVQ
jgi:DNA-binding MarR family transcriptional regulator